MTKPRVAFLASVFAVFALARIAPSADNAPDPGASPTLVNTCLITKDVNRLVQFYEPVLALKARRTGQDYAEFPTDVGVLAIFSEDAQERYIPGSAAAANNHSVVLEFRVADVDQEYRRLQSLVKIWVKPPSTQALGNPLHLLPRPGWKSCRLLRADQASIAYCEFDLTQPPQHFE